MYGRLALDGREPGRYCGHAADMRLAGEMDVSDQIDNSKY